MKNTSLNTVFYQIRNYLAGKALGITRDRSLMHEVVKCLFCKVSHLEEVGGDDNEEAIAKKYREAFSHLKRKNQSIFNQDEEILLDPESIVFIHNALCSVNLEDPTNDPLSELYQVFVSSEARGSEGQFFTPSVAVNWLVQAIAPKEGQKIIDPACGAGSFLSYSARYLKNDGVSSEKINTNLYGLEKDEYLSKLANTHIALSTFAESNVVCADSIERSTLDGKPIPFDLDNQFDVVLANPPFGAKIKIGSEKAKKSFDLAHKWTRSKESGRFLKAESLVANPSPQILFLELCVKLLKDGGRLGIVVPESMLSSSSGGHVVQYLMDNTDINAIVGMPENLFKTSGKGGTHTKTCLVVATKCSAPNPKSKIFMAEAKWCGHDSRGNPIPHNDLPVIIGNYINRIECGGTEAHLGYFVERSQIQNNVLAPRYYNPEPILALNALSATHDLINLGKLVEKGVVSISTGDEVGKLAYGTGSIPFVRTSDISNWEIKLDPKHGVSQEIYEKYAKRQDVKEGDILMVKDGTYLIGTCAFVSKYDTKMLYQSHLYKIRVNDEKVLSPYMLLAALSSPLVIEQIQSKRFTQDIIDSLGKRIMELIIPVPKDYTKRSTIIEMTKRSIDERIESRELARKAKILVGQI
ncbi:type I restriction enzyme M protein [Pseudidiomarina maritima]|uniref:Type I restriction enzyme M protein n=1 Tax=Pseudidiomarina maritima TaxID=519453 RepID=A0A1I6H7A5_9GAMM|nr:N-6 DNA methylase [Pseudidiomarina maritima]SFR50349.1 type I restriction enzyme M protein [Pseudidiomarina maritima]